MADRLITAIRGNLVAWLALFVAMGGTSIAASHYIITSTKQIKPSVLKKLRATGPSGPRGVSGAPGAPGVPGAKGSDGAQGLAGLSATSTLPSGKSESGEYGTVSYTAGLDYQPMTFPVPLAPNESGAGIYAKKVAYMQPKEVDAQCPGVGKAQPGFLCIYSEDVAGLVGPRVSNYERYESSTGAGRFGFVMEWIKVGEGTGYDDGSWTVTAE
jgi:hypothetical protein